MGNAISPLGVDYADANALGNRMNLPYIKAVINDELLSGTTFNRILFPGYQIGSKKRRSMMRGYQDDDGPIVPPWGQRRLKRSIQNSADVARAAQDDEVMRGKKKNTTRKQNEKYELFI